MTRILYVSVTALFRIPILIKALLGKQEIAKQILKCHSRLEHWPKQRMECWANDGLGYNKPPSGFPRSLPVNVVLSSMWYVLDVEKKIGTP